MHTTILWRLKDHLTLHVHAAFIHASAAVSNKYTQCNTIRAAQCLSGVADRLNVATIVSVVVSLYCSQAAALRLTATATPFTIVQPPQLLHRAPSSTGPKAVIGQVKSACCCPATAAPVPVPALLLAAAAAFLASPLSTSRSACSAGGSVPSAFSLLRQDSGIAAGAAAAAATGAAAVVVPAASGDAPETRMRRG
eukprot:9152-Heterococcus_DN1.PRE.3